MSLLTFSIAGSALALVMMLAGFIWLGKRGELERSEMSPEEAGDFVQRGWRQRPGRTWFKGLAWGVSFYGEKSTREIIDLLLAGKWSEGLPWAVPALGALLAFFFWSLFIGIVVGLRGVVLWALVLFFTVGGVQAAWPRGKSGAGK